MPLFRDMQKIGILLLQHLRDHILHRPDNVAAVFREVHAVKKLEIRADGNRDNIGAVKVNFLRICHAANILRGERTRICNAEAALFVNAAAFRHDAVAVTHLIERGDQRLRGQLAFEQIVCRFIDKTAPHIIEIIKAADDDNRQIRRDNVDVPHELHAVHLRHLHIAQQNIDAVFPQPLQRAFAALEVRDDLIFRIIFQIALECVAAGQFIIYDRDLDLTHSASSSTTGRVMIHLVYRPGSLS